MGLGFLKVRFIDEGQWGYELPSCRPDVVEQLSAVQRCSILFLIVCVVGTKEAEGLGWSGHCDSRILSCTCFSNTSAGLFRKRPEDIF